MLEKSRCIALDSLIFMVFLMLSRDLCIYVILVFASLCTLKFLEKTTDPVVMALETTYVNSF